MLKIQTMSNHNSEIRLVTQKINWTCLDLSDVNWYVFTNMSKLVLKRLECFDAIWYNSKTYWDLFLDTWRNTIKIQWIGEELPDKLLLLLLQSDSLDCFEQVERSKNWLRSWKSDWQEILLIPLWPMYMQCSNS